MFTWLKEFFFGKPEPVVEVKVASKPASSKPAPKKAAPKVAKTTKASLTKLTKGQLEAKGREFGIEVDKRKKKDDIVAEVLKASK
jgi:hypothetical protein